ncbi:hypothetical protein BJ944DRAFT_15445 [Cunninghamella echinulata]|nr:hypothetical protein BJ944DRAFT_15445 [Cunninghamella echinulata]
MTTLLYRIGRTVPTTKRLIHTSKYVFSAKPAIDNNNDGTTQNSQIKPAQSTFSKGRKQTRKSKRQLSSIPHSFLFNNFIKHSALTTETIDPIYQFPDYIWQELQLSAQTGLSPKDVLATFDHSDHILLNIPKKGATYLQDKIAKRLASVSKADLIILDPQDFLILAHENSRNVMTIMPTLINANGDDPTILAILPETTKMATTTENNVNRTEEGKEEQYYEDDSRSEVWSVRIGDNYSTSPTSSSQYNQILNDKENLTVKGINSVIERFSIIFKKLIQMKDTSTSKLSSSLPSASASTSSNNNNNNNNNNNSNKNNNTNNKIVYLRDFGDMHDTLGSLMLKSLMMTVEDLRENGQRVIVLGGYSPSLKESSSSSNISKSFSNENELNEDKNNNMNSSGELEGNYAQALQSDKIPVLTGMKCIHVAPPISLSTSSDEWTAWESQLNKDAARRIGEMNARQLMTVYQHKRMIQIKPYKEEEEEHHHYITQLIQQLGEKLNTIQHELWSTEEIDRRVTVAIGHALQKNKDRVDIEDFIKANDIVNQGTSIYRQATKILGKHRSKVKIEKDGSIDTTFLKKECNTYESRLISRIVDPTRVKCTFKDIRVPQTTVDTLQTLISLPLKRPDLFQHGILKRNFISGVLLFGPPGTGKTMLAKAVAKESGSRMLEIQASDVYEMYVGEGEKNVKAIFSLARILSPCVVFIDEVDSLMNKRQSDSTSNAHREIINQFMVEWDGLSSENKGVMIMAATNRPFDLDDAVLRRMPRRILVDLPNEEDREYILKMLLQEEQYDISLKELARATQHYSGSDLKNLCVTAALKCIQQSMPSHNNEPLPNRIILKSHFDEALKMVPPSSSEDMSSLEELRKWAQKYGDTHKKKKQSTFGFS